MALPDIRRRRPSVLFLVVVVGHVILISTQVTARGGASILEAGVFGVVAEVQRAASGVSGEIGQTWRGYLDLRAVWVENERLRRELQAAQAALQEQRALLDRAPGIARLEELRARTALETLMAEVIGTGASPDFRTVTLDRGSSAGVARDQAVLAPEGIVGRVVTASGRAAKVQLLVDRNAAAGALIERSRAQGVVVGDGGDKLRLDYVSEISDVAVGDVVITSGIDGIYPKGFVIGRVETVEKAGNRYRSILIAPSVGFTRLEHVLVVLTPPPPVPDVEPGS